ncbi:aminoglycoside adenylyltransferase domain-containing protein [Virgibacillus ihumii]|uniref:aminoglycoside adenylyltransferase domain-containing protein n=1 Tax=Virgibacillus ihumii TaxID=2686091 RepID=UPI00157DFAF4|nr:aminoglycoside adenylyltransferase domain-containing protein [Virgibacillus ihumii]
MTNSWQTCSTDTKDFILNLLPEVKKIIKEDFIGFYIHGSLAMGGFNPNSSDIDILIVTHNSLTLETKRKLAQLFLYHSNNPFPIEISSLNEQQLKNWRHPSTYDFHYSEFWRECYENDLELGTYQYLNNQIQTDPDLSAHIKITTNRGICIEGKPIDEVFPCVPRSHYISSIMGDFEECLENIEKKPIYCTLNLIRVFWYLKEGFISSKEEAGNWGLLSLPKEMNSTIQKVLYNYSNTEVYDIEKNELHLVRNYMASNVRALLN